MAENKVILEFVGDVSGLKPAIDTLSQLGDLSEEQVNAFKKANAEFSKSTKAANDTEKSVSKLATSFKQVSGAVAGKAIVEPLNQMAKATENANNKTVSLKGELRQLKAELAGLDEGTAEFEKAAFRAAELEDRIGDVQERVRVLASDTFKFDAAVDAIRGVTAAFSVAQGAAALFGSENEDLQKALLRVQGATALLTGVQEIANQVTGQGAGKLAILSAWQKVYTFTTTGATAATNAFRTALIATGVGAAVVALGAIVAYWDEINEGIVKALKYLGLYEGTQNQVTSNTKEYNEQLKETKRLEEDLNNIRQTSKSSEDKIRNLNLEIKLLKFLGASQDDIKKKTIELRESELEQSFNKLKYIELLIKERGEGSALINLRNKEKEQYLSITNQLKALKKEKEEIIKLDLPILISASEKVDRTNIDKATTLYINALKKSIEEKAKKFDALESLGLKRLPDPPPIKIDIDVAKAIEKQKYFKEQFAADIVQAFSTAFDAAFQIAANNRNAQFEEELAQLDQRRERELANKNLTESQKAAIDKRYQKDQATIRQRQFNAEKQASLAQAAINGALAITRVATTTSPVTPLGTPNPGYFAALALTAISTAAQIAVISSQKAPRFAKGGWIEGKPHSQGGTLIEAEKDEFVVRKSAATKNRSFLDAFNSTGNVAKALDLIGYMPQIRDNDMIVMENKTNIDYSKLGRAVAREMAKLPQSELQVNYRGLLTSINSQQSLIEWQKRKYN